MVFTVSWLDRGEEVVKIGVFSESRINYPLKNLEVWIHSSGLILADTSWGLMDPDSFSCFLEQGPDDGGFMTVWKIGNLLWLIEALHIMAIIGAIVSQMFLSSHVGIGSSGHCLAGDFLIIVATSSIQLGLRWRRNAWHAYLLSQLSWLSILLAHRGTPRPSWLWLLFIQRRSVHPYVELYCTTIYSK